MDLARGYRAKNAMIRSKLNGLNGAVGIGLNSDTLLIIKLPDSRALRIMSRSLFLALVLLTLPSIGSFIQGGSNVLYDEYEVESSDLSGLKMLLPNLFRDLVEEGLLRNGHKGLALISGTDDQTKDLDFLNQNGIDLAMESESTLNGNNVIPNDAFDFVFVSKFQNAEAVDRILKTGGIVVSELSNNPLKELQLPSNYRIVYLRRFERVMIAMRKIGSMDFLPNVSTRRTLCGSTPEAKKAALRGLEDAMLEPPRKLMAKSSHGSRKIKFLPDLLKDSLASYPRRIFISDGKKGAVDWFQKNYPTRNQEFEMYNMEIEMYEDPGKSQNVELPLGGVSDWMRNHVREEDYVVMKAEAMVVEEMIKERTICLVDELFLECKNQWEDGEEENSSKRAYWQCLALYGRLRDEGVAVHQWWS